MKLPIKTRILEYAIEKNDFFTVKELSEVLYKEYNGEKTTKVNNVEKLLETYCRVGFIEGHNPSFDEDNELKVMYKITETGRESVKYIPGHGNKLF